MIDLKNIQTIYFIGIGGIGMSALARYFSFHGKAVSGYDRTETPLTRALVEEGIPVHYTEDISVIPKNADVVVYTPAIPKEHQELKYYQENNFTVLKRSDVLGIITAGSFNICVAGTHGKTTISSMVAHLLRHSGYGCNAFLGGIAANYNSNFWSHERNVCVVEADEYDRSFLKLYPDIAVISAMDPDHLDIYVTAENMREAFLAFSEKLKAGGFLLHKAGLPYAEIFRQPERKTYTSADVQANFRATEVTIMEGGYQFEVEAGAHTIKGLRLHMGGMHNIENMVAAIAVAHTLGIEDEKIRSAVDSYRGVKRRFEYITPFVEGNKVVYIDDYAHHPEELRVLIKGARQLFPDSYLMVIFQPHLFTRTRDFAEGFSEVLDTTDETILLPIYPARELPIENVRSEMLLEKMNGDRNRIVQKEQLLNEIEHSIKQVLSSGKKLVVITAGAGDIDRFVQPLGDLIREKYLMKN